MTINDVREILDAEVIIGHNALDREVKTACGADLMSDVLAFAKEKTLLLTGLTNVQVVRTAEVADAVAIVFVRGKCPPDNLIELAASMDLPLMITKLSLYQSCGMLYHAGLGKVDCTPPNGVQHGA